MIQFPFKSFTSQTFDIIHKPFADVEVSVNGHSIVFEFLVDSGADISIVPKQAGAEGLGLRLQSREKILNLGGVGGGEVPYVLRKVEMVIGDERFESRIA